MTILSWFFIGSVSVFLIIFCIGIFSFALFLITNKNLDKLKQKRPKDKRKKKRWLSAKRRLEKKKSVQLKRSIVLILLSLFFIGGGYYVRYYEMTNLSSEDGNAIVQTYFIVDEVDKSLIGIQNGENLEDKKEKLIELSSLLASYGSSMPSSGLSKEGQQALNRYYAQLREYGTNLYSVVPNQLNEPQTVQTYLDTSKRIKQTQKKLFKQFSVDETALKQKK